MKISVLLIALVFAVIFGFSQTPYDFTKVENHINDGIKNGAIPSICIAVTKDGKIIYEKSFGWADKNAGIKATTRTSYQIASASKPMTATGLMVLNHKKIIDIDSPANNYMSPLKFKVYEGNSADVTLKNLLNHTSGLGTYFDISYADENGEKDNFETGFRKYGGLFHPSGLICEYSNLGYGLIDYIIARQSGKTFADFMQDEVFNPLGMTNSFVQNANRKGIQIAKKYDAGLKVLPDILNNTSGAGNIYSSLHDMALFAMFHLKDSVKNQLQILPKGEIDLMHYYVDKNALYQYYDSTTYGLGWYFRQSDNGYKIVWHEGGMMGASSIIKLFPDKDISIVVVINISNRQFCNDITNEISRVILPDYQPTPLNEETEIAEFKPYISDSTYFGIWSGTIKVENKEIPCSLNFQPDGNIIITYLDYTYKSYLTQNNPIPHRTILLAGIINKGSFIGMFPGTLPSNDIRQEFSQIMSLHLFKKGRILSGTIVSLAAAAREYYAYPYYIKLEKK
ncbi:MAG: serine hydrolase domain-containing protein [Ginsengibacter sp.]